MNLKKFVEYFREYGFLFSLKSRVYGKLHLWESLHKLFYFYVDDFFCEQISRYFDCKSILTENSEVSEKRIWVMWLQGVENSPEIIKYCIKSIKKNAQEYDVILLSKENYKQYVNLPSHIVGKFENGKIGYAHFSDIVRMHLMRDYGGVWIDAAMFLSKQFPSEYLEYKLFSIRTKTVDKRFASLGKWTGGFLVTGYSHTVFFELMCEMYDRFWREHNVALGYLMMDYFILVAYNNLQIIKEEIDKIPYNNQESRLLLKNLNALYDEKIWREISENTVVHMLSWKVDILKEFDGGKTFYKMIVCQSEENGRRTGKRRENQKKN